MSNNPIEQILEAIKILNNAKDALGTKEVVQYDLESKIEQSDNAQAAVVLILDDYILIPKSKY